MSFAFDAPPCVEGDPESMPQAMMSGEPLPTESRNLSQTQSLAQSLEGEALWNNVTQRLQLMMSGPAYDSWIAPLRFLGIQGGRAQVVVDKPFIRNWVAKHYRGVLEEAFSISTGEPTTLVLDVQAMDTPSFQPEHSPEQPLLEPTVGDPNKSFLHTHGVPSLAMESLPISAHAVGHQAAVRMKPVVEPQVSGSEDLPMAPRLTVKSSTSSPDGTRRPWTPRSMKSNLNPRYTFDQFVVGQHNRFCHAAALAVAETPGHHYNPLFIYGGVGLGKTHLIQAIGHFALHHQPDMRVRYVTAEHFTNDLIQALMKKEMHGFRERYRKNDILIIDDVQFLEGKERTQEEVFHTFNALHESGKQIVLAGDRQPKFLTDLEPRLRSRFEWGLMTDVGAPDFETRIAILQTKLAKEPQFDSLEFPSSVLSHMATLFPNNIRELEGALTKVAAYAMLTHQPVDLPMACQLLGDAQKPQAVSHGQILQSVALYYHMDVADLVGNSRAKNVSYARQVAIYVLRTLTEASFPKLGEWLGGRKHTTILYAFEKVREEKEQNPVMARQIDELLQRVQQPGL